MSTQTSLVARQYRLQEWANQIQECNRRPSGMTVAEWCKNHDITTANYYYRQTEVRKALLKSTVSVQSSVDSDKQRFIEISGNTTSISDFSESTENPAASIHYGTVCIDLYNSANPLFIRSLLEALTHAK